MMNSSSLYITRIVIGWEKGATVLPHKKGPGMNFQHWSSVCAFISPSYLLRFLPGVFIPGCNTQKATYTLIWSYMLTCVCICICPVMDCQPVLQKKEQGLSGKKMLICVAEAWSEVFLISATHLMIGSSTTFLCFNRSLLKWVNLFLICVFLSL